MRKVIGLIVGGGIAVFAGTTAFEDNTTRGPDGTITGSGGLGAFAIEVGDCVQLPDAPLIASVEGVPCDEPHDAQAYAAHQLRGDSYPGEVATENKGFDGCIDRWRSNLGTDWDTDRTYDVYVMTPTERGWELVDDREVMCFVVRIDGQPIQSDLL